MRAPRRASRTRRSRDSLVESPNEKRKREQKREQRGRNWKNGKTDAASFRRVEKAPFSSWFVPRTGRHARFDLVERRKERRRFDVRANFRPIEMSVGKTGFVFRRGGRTLSWLQLLRARQLDFRIVPLVDRRGKYFWVIVDLTYTKCVK